MSRPGSVNVDGTWVAYDEALDLMVTLQQPRMETWEGDSPARLVFVDCETTGLDPDLHEITEFAWAEVDGPVHTLRLPHQTRTADPAALDISRYVERGLGERSTWTPFRDAGPIVESFLRNAVLAGSNIAFDKGFMRKAFNMTWSHRVLEVPSYALSVTGEDFPSGLHKTAVAVGEVLQVEPPEVIAHSAGGDVELARWVYLACRDWAAEVRAGG